MRIGIIKEVMPHEARVAATPETVKKFVAAGLSVAVEKGAGLLAGVLDADYEAAGAKLVASAQEALSGADIALKIRAPIESEIGLFAKGTRVFAAVNPHKNELLGAYAAAGLEVLAMELMPRITRAQSMDILSSQANIAGYRSVLLATQFYPRFFPMLMTAAGTVKAARVLILGAGVAGLQAIATAKRLGAVVEAFDVRRAAKEQVESLGAKFVEVPIEESGDAAGGYAREMSDEYKAKQAELIHERARQADIVITTALIPGRPAPILIKAATVAAMKAGSVVVDLAVENGGNTEGVVLDEVVTTSNGVILVGLSNLPGMVAADASALFAKNLLNFISPMLDKEKGLVLNPEDELVKATLVVSNGQVLFGKSA
ncbi:Re/Si-specific NAD(P)(+) transhydrogenase subunit alpha [Leeia sp. TBRC 13508]|uniref:proton-translocating NAD(P)(+) transhydrogenase n=2 Tax=Leeia speluncae TaxID=2884804 RepID=A0ABS8D9A1_9NEIS|nr:Re/Si-specific NAD(P)(+) transhydrogenase subunit alpha [Leeia speluncae]